MREAVENAAKYLSEGLLYEGFGLISSRSLGANNNILPPAIPLFF